MPPMPPMWRPAFRPEVKSEAFAGALHDYAVWLNQIKKGRQSSE